MCVCVRERERDRERQRRAGREMLQQVCTHARTHILCVFVNVCGSGGAWMYGCMVVWIIGVCGGLVCYYVLTYIDEY